MDIIPLTFTILVCIVLARLTNIITHYPAGVALFALSGVDYPTETRRAELSFVPFE